MKLTNKFNLPEIMFRAIQNDPYSPGDCDISTTRLISPPQIVALAKRHHEILEEDVSEGIWRLLGQSIHVILERASTEGMISEKRYSAPVAGWKLSGQVDVILGDLLIDFKVTSVWTYIYRSRIKEWTEQANVNRWLAHQNGVMINSLENHLILRDWVKSKAGTGNYPDLQFVSVPLKLWTLSEAEKYVSERVHLHQEAQQASDDELAVKFPCSKEDRWWNEKQKRFIRCESYCSLSPFCLQLEKEKVDSMEIMKKV